MKIITINTHSLEEPEYEQKLYRFVDVVLEEQPDILAMQEVNQSVQAEPFPESELTGYMRCPDYSGQVRRDNHAARLAGLLREKGMLYHWAWVPAKLGYGKYDEGLAVFSRQPIEEVDSFRISRCADYGNWKTRRILGVKNEDGWFYTVHMGWWDDDEEPFVEQWGRLEAHLKENRNLPIWLMGDFNSLDRISGEGYDLVSESGWKDTYRLAQKRDCGITVGKMIDGWRERLSAQKHPEAAEAGEKSGGDGSAACDPGLEGMRIDYIWCRHPVEVCSSCVICNGERYPVVSDHYGVMIETGEILSYE